MNSQDSGRQPGSTQIQPGEQELDEHQPDQGIPEDPQDWQDLGPFDDLEQHGGRDGLPGRQGPLTTPQPR